MDDNILGFPGYHITKEGNTNKYIAKRLKVSGATVGNYLSGKHYKN